MIQIDKRLQNLGQLIVMTVVTPIALLTTVVGGVGLSAIAALNLESNNRISKKSLEMVKLVSVFPSMLFAHLLRVINPNARFKLQGKGPVFGMAPSPSFCSSRTSEKLQKKAIDCYAQNHPLKKYVASRALFALGGIASVVSRTADLAIGLIAASCAILTLGTLKGLNDFAFDNLTFLNVVSDVVISIRGLINPSVAKHIEALSPAPANVPPPIINPPQPPSPIVSSPVPPVSTTQEEDSDVPANPYDFLAYKRSIPKILHTDVVLAKYECILALDPIRDPVGDPTGKTALYERSEILKALAKNPISPGTRLPLQPYQLVEKPAIKALIESRLKLHSDSNKAGLKLVMETPADPILQAAADAEHPLE